MLFKIYTDGSCSTNPGPGGFAFVVLSSRDYELLKVSGCSEKTTNNYMELKAIVSALKHLKGDPKFDLSIHQIEVYSDSAYCVNPLSQGWLKSWSKNDWKTKKGESIKNVELWKELEFILRKMCANVKFIKVKGHSGDKYNEMVNDLAQAATKRALERLKRQESGAANVFNK